MVRSIVVVLWLAGTFAVAEVSEVRPPKNVPAGQLRGEISYGRHKPVVGAIVVVRPENAASPVRIATTGPSGSFGFDGLPEGTYRADVLRDGYLPIAKSGIAVHAPFRAVVEVTLLPGEAALDKPSSPEGVTSIAGTIRVAGGALLAEARVRMTRADGADDARVMFTDGDGRFSSPGLKAGRWRLDVQGAGLLPVRVDLDLAGDVAIDAQLAAQPADYRPLPQDLIVPEEAIPPADGSR